MITGVGTIGIPFLIMDEKEIYFKDGNVIWLKLNNKIVSKYLYYYLLSDRVQKFISTTSGLGTVGTYTIENAKKTPLDIPCIKEQNRIANFLSKLDQNLRFESEKLDLLLKQKQAFMQQMFI